MPATPGSPSPHLDPTYDSVDKMSRRATVDATVMSMGELHLLFDVVGGPTWPMLNRLAGVTSAALR